MAPLDYACSYFDEPSNFVCDARPGELCKWPDGKGGRLEDSQCHPERCEAASAMDAGTGLVPEDEDFDRAVDEVF